jgi:hypothetical protein
MNRSRDTSSTALDVVGRLSEVSRLAGQLADRVLSAQIASQPIPEAQIHALLDAYAVKLPPLLEQMIGKVEDDERDNPAAGCKADGAGVDAERQAWPSPHSEGTKG